MDLRYRRAVVALLFLLCAAGSVSAYNWGWSEPRQLTTTPDNSLLPTYGSGFSNMNSCIHVVFADKQGTNRVVYYLRTTDRGEIWQPLAVIDERTQNNTFSIAADSAGNVHFINRRYSGGLYYRRSADTGATWSAPVEITAECDVALLFTNGQQNVYIFAVSPTSPPGLDLYKSTNGGADWLALGTISYAEGFNGLRGCVSANGNINLFYYYGGSGQARVYQLRSTDNGATWSSEIQVPGIAQNSASEGAWSRGNLVFLATTTFGTATNFRRSTDGGVTWQSGQTLPVLPKSAAWTSDGTAHIVGTRGDSAVVWLKSLNDGATWTTPVVISGTQSGTRSNPYIGTDDAFRLNSVWGSLQTGNVELFTAYGDTVLGIAEPVAGARLPARLDLRPNPARDHVRLAGSTGATVFDREGRAVAALAPGQNSIAHLVPGVYFVRDRGAVAARLVRIE